jgi:hypothetical protein
MRSWCNNTTVPTYVIPQKVDTSISVDDARTKSFDPPPRLGLIMFDALECAWICRTGDKNPFPFVFTSIFILVLLMSARVLEIG